MRKIIYGIVFCLLLAISALIFWANFLYIDQHIYPLNTETLDLSGHPVSGMQRIARLPRLKSADLRGTGLTIEDYKFLQDALPNCNIQWDLPFQGQYYPLDTQSLQISHLSSDDIPALDYLEKLTTVDAMDCQDYAALAELVLRRPECSVSYQVPIDGAVWTCQDTDLNVSTSSIPELRKGLPCLLSDSY